MRRGWILGVLGILLFTLGAGSVIYVRKPVANGLYYPAERDKLLAAVNQYMDEAKVPELPGRYVGCVSPHSAYPFCGAVAGAAFRSLKPGQYDRVIILGSSHFAQFEGCSIPAVQYYETPLGDVELDGPAIGKLQWCPMIDTRSLTHKSVQRFSDGSVRYPLHEVEYSIEVVLPFLQARLGGRFKLVPIVVGSFEGTDGKVDVSSIKSAAEALREIIDDRTFVVASTDLTHFGNAYGYRPFNDNIADNLEELDTQAIELLMNRDTGGFRSYMETTENKICGVSVLELFMRLMPQGTRGVLLDYRTSSQVTGNTDTSVSYASIAFFNPELEPAVAKPMMNLNPVPPPPASDKASVAPPLLPRPAANKAAPVPEKAKKEPKKKGVFHWFGKDKQ